ncbi:MAG TPA: hypothetical protein PKE23_01635 [Anaerolineales bacterium]|nr:hypothetical protein [Anaerolineales bacterium]HNF93971.1 hypothetical protein [Anaerolineales bacterium]HNH26425.1 hypothetical protein [Anaerolineales bacterium]
MKRIFLLLSFAATGIMILSACAAPAERSAAPETSADTSQVLFTIIRADGSTYDVTLNAVKALPLAQVQAEGKTEEGPYLKDVLALAGVTEFTEVSLSGSSNPVTLTFEQVDENTILDFNNHGTMKLSSTYIPKAEWTKDVAEIVVK